MKKLFIPLIALVVTAIISHVLILNAIPNVIMGKAMSSMEERGIPLHRFILASRTTPQTQTVVRPSPDLAYSICLFDFSQIQTPLQIQAQHWSNYASISFFDMQTNNFKTIRIGYADGKIIQTKVLLLPPETLLDDSDTEEAHYIRAPSKRGLILIRRLAPTSQDYEIVREHAVSDICEPFSS